MENFLKVILQEKLQDFLKEIPSDSIDTKKLELLIELKLDKFYKDTKFENLTMDIKNIDLYKHLEILRKFNKTGEISENMCGGKKDERLIMDIYNNCINPIYNILEEMTLFNYYSIIKNIHDKIIYTSLLSSHHDVEYDKIIELFKKIRPNDPLVSLNIIKWTKYVICLVKKCEFDKNGDEEEEFDKNGDEEEEFDKNGDEEEEFDKSGDEEEEFDKSGDEEEEFDKSGDEEEEFDKNGDEEETKKEPKCTRGWRPNVKVLLTVFFCAIMTGTYVITNPDLKNACNTLLLDIQKYKFDRHDRNMINDVFINTTSHVIEQEKGLRDIDYYSKLNPQFNAINKKGIKTYARDLLEETCPIRNVSHFEKKILDVVVLLQNDQDQQVKDKIGQDPVGHKYEKDVNYLNLLNKFKFHGNMFIGVSAATIVYVISKYIYNVINNPVIEHDTYPVKNTGRRPFTRSQIAMTRSGKPYGLGLINYLESNNIGYHPSNGFYYL
jgi:hypothetical protein